MDVHRDGVPPLPEVIEIRAYRIIQEALTNAVRHSGGTWVRITLGYDPRG